MELTDRTMQVLKNYANINPNIILEEGNKLKTVSTAKNIMSRTTLTETFPSKFGIYDLNEFLGVLSLVDDPILEFDSSNDFVTVTDSAKTSRIKYFASDPDMLTSPSKDVIMPEAEVNFVLDTDTLGKIKRAASALGHSEISIEPVDGKIRLSVVDNKNSTSNVFSVDVEGSYSDGFKFILNVNNLKMLGENYDVAISNKLISNFKSKDSDLEYFIALEKTSKYGV